ncbi:12642_t:CDS:2 [Rhizophagus irregularis]|nr:12642_t:CDS:2 [Rhizophagus irregularis]
MYKYYESGCELTGTWDEPLSLNTGYLCDPAFKEYVEFFDKYKEITLYFTEGLERVNSDEYKYALAYFKYAIDLENDWISNLFVTDNDKKGELVKLNKLNGEKLRRSKEIDSYAKACLKVAHDGLLSKIRHEPYRTRGLKDGLQTLPYIVAYIGASNCAKDELFKRFRDEFEELIERIDFTEEQQTLIHILLKKYTQPEESLELKPSDEVEPDEYLCERYETALKRCSSGLKSYEIQ